MLPTKNEETRITGPTSYQSTILGLQQGTITQLPERKESLTLERINSRKNSKVWFKARKYSVRDQTDPEILEPKVPRPGGEREDSFSA